MLLSLPAQRSGQSNGVHNSATPILRADMVIGIHINDLRATGYTHFQHTLHHPEDPAVSTTLVQRLPFRSVSLSSLHPIYELQFQIEQALWEQAPIFCRLILTDFRIKLG